MFEDQNINNPTQAPLPEPAKKLSKKKIFFYFFCLVFLVVAFVAVQSQYELRKLQNPENQQKLAESKTKTILDQLSKLIELPEGEAKIVVVSDVETLKATQPFFIKAQNGDNLVVYENEAILFRQSENRIINIGPVTRTQNATTTPKINFTIEVRNGTEISGKAKNVGETLTSLGFTVVKTGNATNSNFVNTLVYSKPGVDTSAVISTVKGKLITSLPDGEKPLVSDVLVILGKE